MEVVEGRLRTAVKETNVRLEDRLIGMAMTGNGKRKGARN